MRKEGTLHIVWLNRPASDSVYSVGFADYASSGGAMKPRNFNGTHDLRRFLLHDIEVDEVLVNSSLAGLRDEGNASIFNVILTDKQLKALELI